MVLQPDIVPSKYLINIYKILFTALFSHRSFSVKTCAMQLHITLLQKEMAVYLLNQRLGALVLDVPFGRSK